MPYALPDLFSLLKQNQIPDYAKENTGFLKGIFSKKTDQVWEGAKPGLDAIKSRSAWILNDFSREFYKVQAENWPIFGFSTKQFEQFKLSHHYITQESYALLAAETYLIGGYPKNIQYVVFRQFFHLALTRQNDGLFFRAIKTFPAEFHTELFLIKWLSIKIRGEKTSLSEWKNFVHQAQSPVDPSILAEMPWLLAVSICGDDQAKSPLAAAAIFLELHADLEQKRQILPYGNLSALDFSTCSSTEDVARLDYSGRLTLFKLRFYHADESLASTGVEDYFNWVFSGFDWTAEHLVKLLEFGSQERRFSLPKKLLEMATKAMETDAQVYAALFSYLNTLKSNWNNDPNLEKILENYIKNRYQNIGEIAPLSYLHFSGFEPVRPIPTQNIYKGMRPDQMRPYFQLMAEIADVDVLKFYQDSEKNHFVKFRIGEKQYDLKATNGLGVGIISPLNTLLFEHGIPYQFTYLDRTQTDLKGVSHAYYLNFGLLRVILVNEATYKAHQSAFFQTGMAGFAATSGEIVPAFAPNSSSLGKAKTRQDLEKIDLATNPRFSILKDSIGKLEKIEDWNLLVAHCLRYPMDGKPSKSWQEEARKIVLDLGEKMFQEGQVLILNTLSEADEWYADTEKATAMKGLAWTSQCFVGRSQLYMLQKIAIQSYKKVSGGPLNAKLGNVSLDTLAQIGTLEAYGILSNLEAKAGTPVFKRAIEGCRKKFIGLLKDFTTNQLEDISVPDHGLVAGATRLPIEDWTAVLTIQGLKVETTWESPEGKPQKSAPTALKQSAAVALKNLKSEEKSITDTISAQAKRMERFWFTERVWKFAEWRTCILEHPILGVLAKKLVWQTTDGSFSFIPSEHILQNSVGEPVEPDPQTDVRLWHPALATAVETLAWRDFVYSRQITQPFRQAFREVYVLTPAEAETHSFSNRFAGHHLRGNTLYALAKNRGWIIKYQDWPYFLVPGNQFVATLQVNGDILHSEVTTAALRFSLGSASPAYAQGRSNAVPLAEIPPAILSEVMRDVDLFVAVAGIGTDPLFDQKGREDLLPYWQESSFGKKSNTALAEIRRDLLERLLPMTKIANKCQFEGNFLKVQGKLREYKINLGSGNILMQPNDQYLCIVAAQDSKTKAIWLPFEGGDEVLMVILSKAFLLAEDYKIRIPGILEQIQRG